MSIPLQRNGNHYSLSRAVAIMQVKTAGEQASWNRTHGSNTILLIDYRTLEMKTR